MTPARVWQWTWAAVIFASAQPAQATYSIAGADSGTKEVGGAVTSCVGTLDVSVVYGSAPGAGVIHAQAQLDNRLRGHDRAVQRLKEGVAPLEIIQEITATSFDSAAASRQYGVVDVMGRSAGFTGMDAMNFRDDRQGSVGSFAYSVQGNILTSRKVLDQAAAAFEGRGCDLAERLMLALEAGAENGEGDSRCTSSGIPSDSAFIEVDRPGEPAGSYLRLSVTNTKPSSPLPKLRAAFDAWRTMHPCAAVSGGGAGAASAGRSEGIGGTAGVASATGGAGSAAVSCAGASGGAGRSSVSCSGAAGSSPRNATTSGNAAGTGGVGPRGSLAAGSGGGMFGSGTTPGGSSADAASPGLAADKSPRAASGCNVRARGPERPKALPSMLTLCAGWMVVMRKRGARTRRGRPSRRG